MGDSILDFTARVAYEAGGLIMQSYGLPSSARKKADDTTLTDADIQANNFITREIQQRFPHHAILSEETAESTTTLDNRLNSTHLWIIDPLDGTDDFDRQSKDFAVMIAYLFEGQPKASAVYLPARDRLYTASESQGAHLKDGPVSRRIHVSTRTLDDAFLSVSYKTYTPEEAEQMRERIGVKNLTTEGCRGVRICSVAEGRADICFINSPKGGEWDACAPGLILQEAGGKMTDYEGRPLVYNKEHPHLPLGAIFTNGKIHQDILPVMQEHIPVKKK